jgi:hypothetical protein
MYETCKYYEESKPCGLDGKPITNDMKLNFCFYKSKSENCPKQLKNNQIIA